ncbi:MAG: hypothetical protein KAW17_12000 [Candidatus Eisenbacteria sp.]|nr:hypothetical protein [Candidatus Eisenbacteria bacterium]
MKAWILSVVVCGVAFACVSTSHAQDERSSLADLRETWGGVRQPTGIKSLMLIDPARLSVSHSMSFSYGMGSAFGSSGSSAQGLFLNHVRYQLTDQTYFWADVGVGFQPTLNMGADSRAEVVLPGFGIHYQPNDSFRLDVIVQNPNYYYNPYRCWRR